MITSQKLASILDVPYRGPENITISGICLRGDQCKPGDIYIARHGQYCDGHQFIGQALKAGAVGAWVQQWQDIDCPQWLISEPLLYLWQFAEWKRENCHIPLIGVTGTCGKTSTVHLLAYLLRQLNYQVFHPQGSFNNEWGLPVTIINQPETTEIGIYEIGTNYPGEIDKLTALLRPTYAMITTIGAGHLQGLGDCTGVLQEKMGIVRQMLKNGTAIVPADKVVVAKTQRPDVHVIGHGPDSSWDSQILSATLGNTKFQLNTAQGSEIISINQSGQHLAKLGAAIAALLAAMKINWQPQIWRSWPGVPGRMQIIPYQQNFWIHDAYNANPVSMTQALTWLAQQSTDFQRIALLGPMGELGQQSRSYHQKILAFSQELNLDQIITYGQNFQIDQPKFNNVIHFEHWEELQQFCRQTFSQPSILLLKASRLQAFERLLPTEEQLCSTP